MSRLFPFILNNWILGKDESYVNNAYVKLYITLGEKATILATPQATTA